ncbi:LysR family transcriptional regulator [Pseudooceanicola sp. GBMRC 2024]|uniref:LysR family transcriptional regulator n=1 Tax=Pseudooceanicola albus TaxID=2692189 RepID=A0A6L7G2R3_9RHOB|nr:LysR family transcriptional regulator [Pseudooceanicola albus]MXN17972.1 LysR family transcriptional regulator [Pseudooceanicola albus]
MHTVFLRYIDEVARQKSIRRAAARLNVSSTTVNRKILSVEESLGVRLFERTPEGVEMTAVGRVLVEHCRRTMYDFANVRQMIEDIRDMRSGHMTIYSIDAFASRILPEAMIRFSEQYPGITFTVVSAERDQIAQAVLDGTADLGVTLSCRDLPPGVRVLSEKLAPIGAVMRADHPLAERTSLSVEDLQGYPLLRSLDAASRTSVLDQVAQDAPMQTKLIANNLNLAKTLIAANRGVGIYTRVGFLDEIARGEIHFAQIAQPELMQNTIGWIASDSAGVGPAKHMFASCLDRAIRTLDLTG